MAFRIRYRKGGVWHQEERTFETREGSRERPGIEQVAEQLYRPVCDEVEIVRIPPP